MKAICVALLLSSVLFASCSERADLVFPDAIEQASGGGQEDPCEEDCN